MELGEIQKLEVKRITPLGVYLKDINKRSREEVLLPQKEVPQDTKAGDKIKVFVYKDSKESLIATTQEPKLTVGELALLPVGETTKIGAFLDWGLEKDLFLPFKEQKGGVKKGKKYLVGLYIDKSNRLCATMDVYNLLSSESPYEPNDKVQGTIYNIHKDYGAFVAVENKYHGLIHKNELYGQYKPGDNVEVRIKRIREDGKLELSLRKRAHNQLDRDAEIILKELNTKGGRLSLNDDSPPSKIKSELNMSKSAFKRAAGRLLKHNEIKMTQKGIELLKRF